MSGLAYRFIEFSLRLAARLRWLPPLLARLFVGCLFLLSGWGKVHRLAWFTNNFAAWGIPDPAFMAPFVAYTELIGGGMILVGLLTRVVAIPMLANMAVAVAMVKIKEVHTLLDFVSFDEPLYMIVFLWLMIDGPGIISLDYLLERLLKLDGWSRRL